MSCYDQPMFDGLGITLAEKTEISIKTLQLYESIALQHSPDGFYGCFSGGKDSVVVKEIARRAGVKVKWYYSVTTIDPPELVYFIREQHADVEWRLPKRNLWKMVEKKGLPTRLMRWCCAEFKETGGQGLVKITGIRAAESPRRAKQWSVFTPWKNGKGGWVCNPILQWNDEDVWQFIKQENLPYCNLYDQGFKRLGCVGCPMGSKRLQEMQRWPGFERKWRNAAAKFWKIGIESGRESRTFRTFKDADSFFNWWATGEAMPEEKDKEDDCQMGLF